MSALRNLPGQFKQPSTTSKQPSILVDSSENAVKVTLNRPKAFNAMNSDMLNQLQSEVNKLNSNPKIKVALFVGSGGKAFSAGGDLKFPYEAKMANKEHLQNAEFAKLLQLFYSMARMKPIQVVFWDGITIGAGIGIAASASIRIVTEFAEFSMPEAKFGMHLGVEAGYFFSRMKNHLGYYIGLTGARITGPQWIHCGAADYFVKRENLKKLEEEIMRETGPNTDLKDIQNIVKKYQEPCVTGFPNEELINEIFGKESLEEIYLELEKRSKDSEFARKTLEMMHLNSPLAQKIIFEQMKRGKYLDYEENLKIDMRIESRLLMESDFLEGLRCLLIDKGSKPNWQYKTIFDVPNSKVAQCFEKLPDNLELSLPSYSH